jgi:hypothetical protein
MVGGSNTAYLGGGIYTKGTLELNDTKVRDTNQAYQGGGIFEAGAGPITLNGDTVVCGNIGGQCEGFTDPKCQTTCP